MWLLPNPLVRHYGFYHTFAAKNMLIMRGDFVHASGPGSTNTRAHLEFFPREAAGWTRKRTFWNLKNLPKIHPTFLWQKPTYPFAFPNAAEPSVDGDVCSYNVPAKFDQNITNTLIRKTMQKRALGICTRVATRKATPQSRMRQSTGAVLVSLRHYFYMHLTQNLKLIVYTCLMSTP
jgi:hypothetical protein